MKFHASPSMLKGVQKGSLLMREDSYTEILGRLRAHEECSTLISPAFLEFVNPDTDEHVGLNGFSAKSQ